MSALIEPYAEGFSIKDVVPDIEQAQAFLESIGIPPGEPVVIRAIRKKDGKVRKYYGTPAEHAEALIRDNRAGFNVYLMLNKAGDKLDDDGHVSASTDNIIEVRGAFIDLDEEWNPRECSKALAETPLPFSNGMCTHMNRYQAVFRIEGWLVTDTQEAADQYSSLQALLAAHFGSDTNVYRLCNLIRMPGFWHVKNVDNLKPVHKGVKSTFL